MFEEIPLNDLSLARKNAMRSEYHELVETIIAELPNSRERSLAITKLEESFDWIVKAITTSQSS